MYTFQEIVRGRLGAPGHVHRRDSSAQITTIDSSCDTATTSHEDVVTADRYNLAAAVSAAAASVNKRRRSSLAQVGRTESNTGRAGGLS